jgi:hypothetical protein
MRKNVREIYKKSRPRPRRAAAAMPKTEVDPLLQIQARCRHLPLMDAFIAPAARFDVMGLVPILNGAAVLALTNVTATMRRPSGAILSYQRSERSGAVLLSMSGAEARGRAW